MNLTDIEIETLLFGQWRFNTDWEKSYIKFKNDMTYEQNRIQAFILAKPRDLITGYRFTGLWYVNDRRLCLILKNIPKSFLNFKLPVFSKIYLADTVASFSSFLIPEMYEVIQIDKSKFLGRNKETSIIGTKIN